jgi:hypothetical protein
MRGKGRLIRGRRSQSQGHGNWRRHNFENTSNQKTILFHPDKTVAVVERQYCQNRKPLVNCSRYGQSTALNCRRQTSSHRAQSGFYLGIPAASPAHHESQNKDAARDECEASHQTKVSRPGASTRLTRKAHPLRSNPGLAVAPSPPGYRQIPLPGRSPSRLILYFKYQT